MTPTDASPLRPLLPAAPIDRLTRPLREYLAVESTSGALLLAAAAAAVGVANSPLAGAADRLWHLPLTVGAGPFALAEPLHFWVTDALMTLFFFVVGLEIKRELVAGELSTLKKAALPVVAAGGGMLVPAGVYLLVQGGGPAGRGWGVPMATDIAFVAGVLALLGPRVPAGLKVFLLALAIADDIGAILVIAAAYSGPPDPEAAATAVFWLGVVAGLNRLGVRAVGVYVVVGAGVWLAALQSGVHPTVAGVALGLLTPSGTWVGRTALRLAVGDLAARLGDDGEGEVEPADLYLLRFAAREAVSPLERIEAGLHPWVAFAVMPLFALANAGVEVRAEALADPVALAVALGLVVGKPAGIVGFSYLAVRTGVAALPAGVTWRAMAGAGCLGGIGFTMALFVAGLALGPDHLAAGKVGILAGSAASAALGTGLLLWGLPRPKVEAKGKAGG